MLLSLIVIGTAFILHEIGHKVVAQRYGCWAEFRMSSNMLVLMLFIAILTGFVFAAPGAVMISGYQITKEQNGKISIAGPLTNIALVFLFLPISFLWGFPGEIGRWGAWINGLIAAFNMIPFGVLDGRKVLAWERRIYVIVAAISLFVFLSVGAGIFYG
jgi:Zn-dependent protease